MNTNVIFKEKQFTWNGTLCLGYAIAIIISLPLVTIPFGLAIALFFYLWKLGRDNRIYTLTNDAIIIELGILNKTTRKIPLSKVQDVTLKQGLIQKQFNVGDLFLESAGKSGGGEPIKDILDPHKRMEQILEIVHKK